MDLRELLQNKMVNKTPLMENRTVLPLDEILNQVIHIIDVDMVEGRWGAYLVLNLEEYPENYVNFGGAGSGWLMETISEVGGIAEFANMVRAAPLEVRFKRIRSSNLTEEGQPKYYHKMEVL